ncbi:unnamed protein product [Caenorhabditis sp. 36 PRJEB53466]|nr:unnamed protein product [Caenorhabditis sp. 36 PRJEB53466]
MSTDLWKTPTISQTLQLPEDSAIGQKVTIRMKEMHGLAWIGHWTVLNTAKGEFQLKCNEDSLCAWEFVAHVEAEFRGDGRKTEKVEQEVRFSDKLTILNMKWVEEGRKYNQVELKITRKAAFSVPSTSFLDFGKKSKWLNVLIRDEQNSIQMYGNSGILAIHSPVLKAQFDADESEEHEIVISLDLFPAMTELLNFLHPPCSFRKPHSSSDIENVLNLAQKWEMETVLKKSEELLINERMASNEGIDRSIKLAEKFHFRKLLEEVLVNDVASDTIFGLLALNEYGEWARAAMLSRLLEGSESSEYSDDHDEDDSFEEERDYGGGGGRSDCRQM